MSNIEIRERNKERVLCCINRGKEHATKRMTIAWWTNLRDRTVRNMIEELRRDGHLICNAQDGSGYYIAVTDDEILGQYRRECARAMSILTSLKAFRKAARTIQEREENKDQLMIEDILMYMEGKI